MEPIKINRGQILSMWQVAQTFGVDAEMTITEQRGDGSIWLSARSPLDSSVYCFPTSGGSLRTKMQPGDVARDFSETEDTSPSS